MLIRMFLIRLYPLPLKPTDPSTVIEHTFAQAYTAPLTNRVDPFVSTTFMKDAQTEMPDHVDALQRLGSGLIEKQQYYHTLQEGIEDALSKQSYFGRGVDMIKDSF